MEQDPGKYRTCGYLPVPGPLSQPVDLGPGDSVGQERDVLLSHLFIQVLSKQWHMVRPVTLITAQKTCSGYPAKKTGGQKPSTHQQCPATALPAYVASRSPVFMQTFLAHKSLLDAPCHLYPHLSSLRSEEPEQPPWLPGQSSFSVCLWVQTLSLPLFSFLLAFGRQTGELYGMSSYN